MKKSVLRFGLFSVLLLLIFFFVEWIIYRNGTVDWELREMIGWIGIFMSTVFIFFGLKYYRDVQNNGNLSVGNGLKLGLLITLFPAVAFGLFNVFYILVLDPDFLITYYNHKVEQITSTANINEVNRRISELQEEKEMFTNPFVQFIAMFLSVFFAGLIVTIISTLILKKRKIETI